MSEQKKLDLRNEPGIRHAAKIFGEEKAEMIAEFWSDLDEHFAKAICNYSYGEMYSRDVLPQRDRELCAVMALTCLAKPLALKVHVEAALTCGATKKEVTEVICQAHIYAGIPATMDGLVIMREAIAEMQARGIDVR